MRHHPDILDAGSIALVVVDVQERINAVMADQHHVPRLAVLVRAFQALDLPVLVTEQYPKGLGNTIPELAAIAGGTPLVKDSFSCSGDTAFVAALERLRPRQVLLTGIETHVCVAQTALDLLHAGYQVQIPHDAVNSRRSADRKWALHRLQQAGAIISSTESALFELLDRCGTEDFRTISKLIKVIPL